MVQILHRRTTPDMMMIFNIGVAENRIIPVEEDRVEFDGEFTAPATNNTGGVVCLWDKSKLDVAYVYVGSEEIAYISTSLAPLRYGVGAILY
ncbi:hypothetical protein SLA2020_067390 [Shorea laevis]